jgi:predicted amidohydrolase
MPEPWVDLSGTQDLYATGGSLAVAETPLGTLGVNLCADNFPDSLALGHSLARMGCRLLLSPSAWAVEADYDNEREPYGALWRESYTKLAQLYDMTVIGVSNVGWLRGGPWEGRKCIGCSLAVGPGGRILAQGPYGDGAEALIPVDVEVTDLGLTGTALSERVSEVTARE